jgi:peptidoglycan/xylan/chitin deacetylase (PgdA/CDA1 family)
MKVSPLARRNAWLSWAVAASVAAPLSAPGCASNVAPEAERTASSAEALASSANPPGGLSVSQVPQFVEVTFDDNFTPEGMDWATSFLRPLHNPAGSGNPGTFDGAPVRTTFPSNSLYLSGMQTSWQTAVNDGHEFANHTVNHGDGIGYTTDQWGSEIVECTSALVNGLSAPSSPLRITGFRSPYLHYNDNLFTVLVNNGFAYDTSIMTGWADAQTGKNCSWPYTMENGSPDADTIFTKWTGRNVVQVGPHAIWELPVAVVFVPDDSLAAQYGFPAGLRQRTANAMAGEGNPNFFELSTGKMVGMDISMVLDGRMSKAEALATLKDTLDLRLAGNRAPMIFVAHTHVYASNWDANAPNVQNIADRRSILSDFLTYALSNPVVRMRPLSDVLAWMKNPVPLGACTATTCAAQGKTCGPVSDGCGGTLNCGTCASGQVCTSANVCQACTKTTCAAAGATCGSIADGCGGTLGCGTCAAGQTCSSANTCQTASTCSPSVSGYTLGKCNATAVYNGALYKCLSQAAGVNGEPAGCGTAGVYCSSIAPDNAAWGSTAWQRVGSCDTSCTPTTCAARGKNCGALADGCGGTLACGTCASGQTCSSANTCQATCTPTTCAAQGKNCGSVADGCGGTLTCGTCAGGQTCSSSNTCQTASSGCTPTIGSYAQGKCGATASYNGKLYSCISQAAGVNGEPSGCGTTGVYCSSIAPDNAAWGSVAWQPVTGCN